MLRSIFSTTFVILFFTAIGYCSLFATSPIPTVNNSTKNRLTADLVYGGYLSSFIEAGNDTAKYLDWLSNIIPHSKTIKAIDFSSNGTGFFTQNHWLSIDTGKVNQGRADITFPFDNGMYDVVFSGIGESRGQSAFRMLVNSIEVGRCLTPLSKRSFEEGAPFLELWENIEVKKGDTISIIAVVDSREEKRSGTGSWTGVVFTPMTRGKDLLARARDLGAGQNGEENSDKNNQITVIQETNNPELSDDGGKDGDGSVSVSGELKQWHKITLTLDGPFASEMDENPNPFTDYCMTVRFVHESGSPEYEVPAYFTADGNAAETSAIYGTKWRAHLSPDKTGKWNYKIYFIKGVLVAVADMPWATRLVPYDGLEGSFEISATDKSGGDLRGNGRLEYVGKHHLQFQGTGDFFYKVGSDSPETLLAYEDFDNTVAMKPNVPLKEYSSHLQDYQEGDPSWKNGKGKGLIGAINYLSGKGINAFSFLTYNAGGDGDNVWPFVSRNDKLHYDCSKLDQWQIVFDHAQRKGMFLHFKTQETENDDNILGRETVSIVAESLDGGNLGPERRLYYRELIARYGYLLALNWNLGEENSQTAEQQREMVDYFQENDPYKHLVVLHSFPKQQDKVYYPLLGANSDLTGVSLQNDWDAVFEQTLKWVTKSKASGKPWVVSNDEQGPAGKGVPPDPGYRGFDESTAGYTLDDIRKRTLWGNIMAGGAGVEYYFGYQLPENDLMAEDFRSRDKSWDYAWIAINFLSENQIPFQNMENMNFLIGEGKRGNDKYCLAKGGEIYLIYLTNFSTSTLDLTGISGDFTIDWFNPVIGGPMLKGSKRTVKGGKIISLGQAPDQSDHDWLVLVRKKNVN